MGPSSSKTSVFERARQRVIQETIARGDSNHIRGSVHYLVALLEAGERLDEADQVLNRVLDAQGIQGDRHARIYGNFKWDLDDAFWKDYNAGPFICMDLTMIARHHQEKLKPETRRRFEEALRRALVGLQNRQATVYCLYRLVLS